MARKLLSEDPDNVHDGYCRQLQPSQLTCTVPGSLRLVYSAVLTYCTVTSRAHHQRKAMKETPLAASQQQLHQSERIAFWSAARQSEDHNSLQVVEAKQLSDHQTRPRQPTVSQHACCPSVGTPLMGASVIALPSIRLRCRADLTLREEVDEYIIQGVSTAILQLRSQHFAERLQGSGRENYL